MSKKQTVWLVGRYLDGGIVLETTASGDFVRVEVRPEVSDG